MDSAEGKCQLSAPRYGLVFFCVCLAVLIIDQWTKHLVSTSMTLGQTIELPVSFVQLTYVRNFGGAFGMFIDAQVIFITAAIFTIGAVYWQFPQICAATGYRGCVICAGIVAGGLGNLIDRMRLGYVVDMIDLKWWPVFNVADIGISVGITIAVFWMAFSSFGSNDSTESSANDVGVISEGERN